MTQEEFLGRLWPLIENAVQWVGILYCVVAVVVLGLCLYAFVRWFKEEA